MQSLKSIRLPEVDNFFKQSFEQKKLIPLYGPLNNSATLAEMPAHTDVIIVEECSQGPGVWRAKQVKIILAGGHVRASAGALAVHTALILAGGHVRASAGAPGGPHGFNSVCVSVCLSVCPVTNSSLITPRIGTKFVSVDR